MYARHRSSANGTPVCSVNWHGRLLILPIGDDDADNFPSMLTCLPTLLSTTHSDDELPYRSEKLWIIFSYNCVRYARNTTRQRDS